VAYTLPPSARPQSITPWVAIFFVITIFIGTFILLQLFLAILLSGLHSVRADLSPQSALSGTRALRAKLLQPAACTASCRFTDSRQCCL